MTEEQFKLVCRNRSEVKMLRESMENALRPWIGEDDYQFSSPMHPATRLAIAKLIREDYEPRIAEAEKAFARL